MAATEITQCITNAIDKFGGNEDG